MNSRGRFVMKVVSVLSILIGAIFNSGLAIGGSPVGVVVNQHAKPDQIESFFPSHLANASAGTIINAVLKDRIWLAPFMAPAGGFAFDRIVATFDTTYSQSRSTKFSFGVYDRQGKAVALSDVLTSLTAQGPLVEIAIAGNLEPNTMYYTAWGFNGGDSPMLSLAHTGALPNGGWLMGTSGPGQLPLTIHMDWFLQDKFYFPIGVTFLRLTPDARTAVGSKEWKAYP